MMAASELARVRVLCVEDNKQVADALRTHLSRDPRMEWVGWLPSADALVHTVASDDPAIVILDLDMPGRDPFEALAELSSDHSSARVVIFSGHVSAALVDRAIQSGAWGYVSKDDGQDALITAIERVHAGEFALSPGARAAIRA
jgi:DNA-binding NarL/FixJ family response regulator